MMEQFSATPSSSRVMFDEEDNNGLVLCDKYLPIEMLTEIFYYIADCKADVLRYLLVCRRWKMLMNHIWHKKTERTLGKPFPWNDEMPWTVYYLACTKKPYERNLVKNHSGAEGFDHWNLFHNDDGSMDRRGGWTVEEPPTGKGTSDLPQTEPLFKDRQICFATSYDYCTKVQVIILTDEGIHPYILDTYQPPIEMMGQFSATPSSSRVMFDEEDNNGLVLCDKYLPVEVLIEIFCHVDCKTLLRCQLVCKRWKMLMNHVWHKKTEWTMGKPFPWNDKMPWTVYYLACTKKPYERNLVKNHSGVENSDHWDISYDGGDRWTVEEPPAGMPELPQTEPLFKDRQICFATSYENCTKVQVIILTDEGIHPHILDTYQPPIEVSEWYGCRWDCPARYQLRVKLFRNDNKMIDEFLFKDVLEGEKQNQWLKITHVFKNYGPGLRRITFEHSGKDRSFWAGHYGSKMAGACVCVRSP